MTPPPAAPRVGLLSLGCPRTLVDSEVLLGRLQSTSFVLADEVTDADIAIVNTCAFIQESIQESIDAILDLAELKKQGKLKAIIVAGCLGQRFKQGLIEELKEIDGLVGVDAFQDIDQVVAKVWAGERPVMIRPRPQVPHFGLADRVALTPNHYAYLKIGEGCLRGCSFCIIPKMKGPLHSRPLETAIAEARQLVAERGCRELIVIGQDTSDYGVDLYGVQRLPELLDGLSQVEGLQWIRLLYCHPKGVTDELIDVIASRSSICKYLDMAIEHSEDRVLSRMNRGMTRQGLLELIRKLRSRVPGITLRTSVIVGFPGETEEEFQGLLRFLREVQFERLGAFAYSKEEGTGSFNLDGHMPDDVKQQRLAAVMAVQQEISREVMRRSIGQTVLVHIDEADGSDPHLFLGRTTADCPEVDGCVYVKSPAAPLRPGDFVQVRITDTYEYDLVGESLAAPPAAVHT